MFQQGKDLIECIKKAMAFLSAIAPRRRAYGETVHPAKKDKKFYWFKEKLMLAEVQKAGQILDEEKLAFLAHPRMDETPVASQIIPHNSAFQTKDLDAYESNCDDISSAKAVLMANLLSCDYDVLSEVPYSDTYLNDLINQDVQEMTYSKQTHLNDFPDIEIISYSNIIPYSQYLQETQDAGIKDTNSPTPNNVLVLSLVEQMTDHVAHLDKENQTNKIVNESLSTELERYKEQHVVISVIDDEETLILEDKSRSKMLLKQNDPISIEKKVNIAQIDYLKLNNLKEDFGKHFITQQELSTEQAFLLKHSSISKTPVKSHTPIRVEAPSELPKSHEKDMVIRKLKDKIKSLSGKDSVEKVKKDIDEIETINIELEHSEVSVYFKETCPCLSKHSKKLVAVNKDKIVRFVDPLTSSSNTQIPKDSNKPMLPSTRVICSTSASGSQPSSNIRNDKILQPSCSNKTNKVEDQSRSVKSRKNKKNCVEKTKYNAHVMQSMLNENSISESTSNALVKHSVKTAKFESMCAICNKCFFDANHDMYLIDYVNDVNVSSKSKNKRNKKRNVWKPMGKVFTKIGYSWKPTGRTFTIVGNRCHLTRITSTKTVLPKESTIVPVITPTSGILVYSRRPKATRSIGCPNCYVVFGLRVLQAHDQNSLSTHQLLIASKPAVLTGTPLSTTIDQDVPSTSPSQTTPETPSPIIPLGVEETDHDIEVAHMDNNPFAEFPIREPSSEESSTQVKLDELGGVLKNKARLVVRGYHLEEGMDFEKSFAPVAILEAIRIFIAFVVHMNMVVDQMDVKTVFLNEILHEEDSCIALTAFADADHAGCQDTKKSTSRSMQLLGERLVKMDESDLTIEEYFELKTKKAQRREEMFNWKLQHTVRAPKKVLIRDEAKSLVTKNINSISLARGEKERNENDDMATDGGINGIDMEMPEKEAKKEIEAENGIKNKPIKRTKEEETTKASSSQPVGYYLKHRINEKVIAGLVDNHRFNDSSSRIRVRKVKGKTYNLLPRGPVYEAILRKKITRKEDIRGNFEIPCNIGGLKHKNVLLT
nr:retrovirus-related Pol polyprotein from transposon TNT 1-94 [Tanacetum cinerariifolium]